MKASEAKKGYINEKENIDSTKTSLKNKNPSKSTGREITEALIIAIILAVFIRTFVIQAFKIPSESMKPTLLIGDYLLVNKFIFGETIPFTNKKFLRFKDPKFNDVIVFKFPNDQDKDYIKRVIGVPGDEIKILNKHLYINGKPRDSEFAVWTDDAEDVTTRDNYGPIKVPPGKLFVMGDNRDNSYDSRYWGMVPMEYVRGKALIIYFSWNSLQPNIWEKIKSIRWCRFGKVIK